MKRRGEDTTPPPPGWDTGSDKKPRRRRVYEWTQEVRNRARGEPNHPRHRGHVAVLTEAETYGWAARGERSVRRREWRRRVVAIGAQLFLRNGMSDAINGDLSVRAVVDTARMEWASSPSGSVWRKRVHLVGRQSRAKSRLLCATSQSRGFRRTTILREKRFSYLTACSPMSTATGPLVPTSSIPRAFGTLLLPNPAASCSSSSGSSPGRERRHVVVDTHKLDWQPSSIPGVAQKALYQQSGFHDAMRLERWDPQTDLGTITYERGAEFFVLAGGFTDDAGALLRRVLDASAGWL